MVAGVGLALLLTGCTGSSKKAASGPSSGSTPADAQKVFDRPAYQGARWLYQIEDLDTGKVLASNRANELVFTASTGKQFTVGTAYDSLGADSRLTTPVYASGPVADGVLSGNLTLVASGDLTLGGRDADKDKAANAFSDTATDHVYGDIAPNALPAPGDPLAGLNSLAGQVAAKGIKLIKGDVLVDDRLWDPYTAQEGPVPSVYVNDNLLDLVVTPGQEGQPGVVSTTPQTAAFKVDNQVTTVAGKDASLKVAADPVDPHLLHLTGTVGASSGPRMTVYRVKDAASWARTLFVEALNRAGVLVTAESTAANNSGLLTARASYGAATPVATFKSPPLSAFGDLILETSYNTGANALLCLIAVHSGSTNCTDGLKVIHQLASKAGMNDKNLILVDGQGGDGESSTSVDMIKWLRFAMKQPWGKAMREGQPVLGETGTLAGVGRNGAGKGKIAAKTGTSARPDEGNGRTFFNVQSLAGFMTAANGHTLVFNISMSGGVYTDILQGLAQSNEDVATVAVAFEQSLE
ncbi:MAG: D-alanyl-D-alanine carboxypeptidase/D-alanyl-D-alanine-endopeptidase [Actinobacteria bacterium]|nr:D-alanyl-D-alanine carboxypeptidase/D-alanyl-D-alanine-endopeptidase [Actinomycetota bacterium]